MLTDERLKELMQQVGMPDSRSLMNALKQCDMEAAIKERDRCAALCKHLADCEENTGDYRAGASWCYEIIMARNTSLHSPKK